MTGGDGTNLVILTPAEDTYVDSEAPNANFGDAETMHITDLVNFGGGGGLIVHQRIGLVRFDEEQVRAELGRGHVLSAQLTVWLQSVAGDACSRTYSAGAVHQIWSQMGATFRSPTGTGDTWDWDLTTSTPPAGPATGSPVSCSFVDGSTRLVFDVTRDLADPTSDAVAFGWAIGSLHVTDTHIATAEAMTSETIKPPRLEILLAAPGYVPSEPIHAPALDRTRPTSVYDATRFVYDPTYHVSADDDAVQWDIDPRIIEPDRAAAIHGRVLSLDGSPLAAVDVSVHGHPEYGQTRSRASGEFDLVVNGGGAMVLDYHLDDTHLPAQRTVEVQWNDYATAPDVTLMPIPNNCTGAISPATGGLFFGGGVGPWTTRDVRGTRSIGFFIPSGTTSTATSGDYYLCVDEYTRRPASHGICTEASPNVCTDGFVCIDSECVADPRSTMPADIASGTSYTFSTEACVRDEPGAPCGSTEFGAEIYRYVVVYRPIPGGVDESFALDIADSDHGVGRVIPSGSYDARTAAWAPEANGFIAEVQRSHPGCPLVGLDEAPAEYQPSTDECDAIYGSADLPNGTRLWRVPTRHFSATDDNWSGQSGAPIAQGVASSGGPDTDHCGDGSILFCESRALGERVPVAGAGFSLAYSSANQQGRVIDNSVIVHPVPIVPDADVAFGIRAVHVAVTVAGQRLPPYTFSNAELFSNVTPPPGELPPNEHRFVWDGRDQWGRPTVGPQPGRVAMTYVVEVRQIRTPLAENDRAFGAPFVVVTTGGVGGSGGAAATFGSPVMITYTVTRDVIVGTVDDVTQGLAGWNLDIHHTYSPVAHAVYFGSGGRATVRGAGNVASFLPGSFQPCTGAAPNECGGCTTGGSTTLFGVAAAPDGSAFMVGGPGSGRGDPPRVWRTDPDGSRVELGPVGDHARIAAGRLSSAAGGVEATTLFVASTNCLQRFRADGPSLLTEATAGECMATCSGDGLSVGHPRPRDATGPLCLDPGSVDLARDGSLYVIDRRSPSRLLRWRTDGGVEVVATARASQAFIAVEATDRGTLYLAVRSSNGFGAEDEIYRFDPDLLDPRDCSDAVSCMTRVVGNAAPTFDRCPPNGARSLAEGTAGSCFDLDLVATPNSDSGPSDSSDGALASDREGRLYFTQHYSQLSGPRAGIASVWRLELDGTVTFVAGPRPTSADGTPLCDLRGPDGSALDLCHPLPLPGVTSCDPHAPATAMARFAIEDLDLLPDGRPVIAVPDGILVIGPVLEGSIEVDRHTVASPDGSAIFEFDRAGRHLRTVDYLTQRTLWSFGYRPEDGRLATVTDPEGQVTSFDYSVPNTIRIEAPGHLVTTLTSTDATHQTIADPEGHTWSLGYDPDLHGLLRSFQEPGVPAAHLFTYEADGRLRSDSTVPDSGGGPGPTSTLLETDRTADGMRAFTLTSAESRTTTYTTGDTGWTHRTTRAVPSGARERMAAPADGLRILSAVELPGAMTGCRRPSSTMPSGCPAGEACMVEASTTGGDDNGLCVPYLLTADLADHPDVDIGPDARHAYRTIVERRATTDASGTVELLTSTYLHEQQFDPDGRLRDAFTYPTQTGAATITVRSTRSSASSPRATTTTTITADPAGHTPETTITRDDHARVTCIATAGLHPTRITYTGDSVRPSSVAQGPFGAGCTGGAAPLRQVTYGYPSDGTRWLTSVSVGAPDGPVLTTGLTPIHGTGWVTDVDLPGAEGVIHVGYDARGNITSFAPPGRPAHTFTVTQRDLPLTSTPPVGGPRVTGTTYTDDGMLETLTLSDGTSLGLTYSADGVLHTMDASDGSVHIAVNHHDALGQPTAVSDASTGVSMQLGYDVSVPVSQSWAGPGGLSASTRRVVGAAMTVDSETVQLTTGGTLATAASFGHRYDADLALTRNALSTASFEDESALDYHRMAPDGNASFPVLDVSASADGRAPLTTTVRATQLGELDRLTTTGEYEAEICARDGTGRITRRVESVRRAGSTVIDYVGHEYVYTDERLTTYRRYALSAANGASCAVWASAPPVIPTTQTFGYTPNGGVTSGTDDRCPPSQYDASDRPGCRGRHYDAHGRLSSRTGERFTYDVLGRLRSHRRGSTTTTYDWDPAGRLVGIDDGEPSHDEHFVYGSAMGPIAWRRGAATAYFAYGSQPHVPDAMWLDRDGDGSIDERYRLLTDERGSVRVVVRLDGAGAGTVAQRIEYSVWGVPTETGSARLQPFGFAGGIWLAGPRMWRFGARDYDPSVASWTGADPIGFAGGENQYGYCGGDPVNCVDPGGRDATESLGDWLASFGAQNYAVGFAEGLNPLGLLGFHPFMAMANAGSGACSGIVDTNSGGYLAGGLVSIPVSFVLTSGLLGFLGSRLAPVAQGSFRLLGANARTLGVGVYQTNGFTWLRLTDAFRIEAHATGFYNIHAHIPYWTLTQHIDLGYLVAAGVGAYGYFHEE